MHYLANGTRFEYSGNAAGEYPVWGDYIRMSLVKYGPDSTLIFSTAMLDAPSGIEMELRRDGWAGDVTEVFTHLGKGESARVHVPVWVADKDSSLMDSKGFYFYEITLHDFTPRTVFEEKKRQRLDSLKLKEYGIFKDLAKAFEIRRQIFDSSGAVLIFLREQPEADPVSLGEAVTVHYMLQTLPDGRSLDNSYLRGQPFTFRLGKGEVIKGWDIGIALMRKGEKAVLLVPSWLAYGERGAGKDIAPDTPLYFEVEVLP